MKKEKVMRKQNRKIKDLRRFYRWSCCIARRHCENFRLARWSLHDRDNKRRSQCRNNAKQKFSDKAAEAHDKVNSISNDLKSAIERDPLVAVLLAALAGFIIGTLSRSRKWAAFSSGKCRRLWHRLNAWRSAFCVKQRWPLSHSRASSPASPSFRSQASSGCPVSPAQPWRLWRSPASICLSRLSASSRRAVAAQRQNQPRQPSKERRTAPLTIQCSKIRHSRTLLEQTATQTDEDKKSEYFLILLLIN